MARKGRAPVRALVDLVRTLRPDLDPAEAIAAGLVLVNGRPVTNPRSRVRADAAVTVRGADPLRGEAKLLAALAAFAVPVAGRVALDLGAAAGGFTRTLLRAGAARVYAVDAGYGQLLGSLRLDPRVVNLERTNLGALTGRLVPEPVGLVTADLSYLSLADALPQLEGPVRIASDADLLAVVKPQFELGLARAPSGVAAIAEAGRRAAGGSERAGWRSPELVRSPVTGSRGAVELLLHARRRA